MRYYGKELILKLKILFVITALLFVSITPFISGLENAKPNENMPAFTIFKSDITGVDFLVNSKDFSTSMVEANGVEYNKIKIQNCGFTSDYGKSELPVLSYYLAVPQGAKVNLNYETSDPIILENYYIYPSQPPMPETYGYVDPPFTKNETFYEKNEFYPSSIVDISADVIMRGCRIIRVSVYPYTFNPVSKLLKKYNNIEISIDFIGGTNEYIPKRYRSIYFQPLYDAFLINSQNIERAEINNPPTIPVGRDNGAELLIVVYDDFYEEILPLANWRHQSGIETKVVKWSEIGSTSENLRDYVSNAYYNWIIPPSFLLIVGDADHVPVNYLYNHPYDGKKTGTDHWYVAFQGNDYLPEIHTGRISVDNEAELNTVVYKILNYSRTPYMDIDWFDQVLLAAYNESGRYFVWTSDTIYNFLISIGWNPHRQYQGGTPPGSTQGVINCINYGMLIANHRDHGASQNDGYSYTGWSYPHFTTDDILNNIDNGEKWPVMFSLNCDSGWFDGETDQNSGNYESIGEVGLRVANKGFVAVICASRVSYSGYNDEFCRGLYDGIFEDFDPDYPTGGSANPYDTAVYKISQIMNYGKFWMYDKYIVPGGCSPYPWTPSESVSRTTFEMFHDHGDPTMEIWTAFPQSMLVDHIDTVPIGPSSVTINVTRIYGDPLIGALVCLSQQDGIYVKGFTNETGYVTLNIEPSTGESISIVVSKHNYLPYSGVINVEAGDPPLTPTTPNGQNSGKVGLEYTYSTVTTDPNEDQIYYMFNWGDGSYSDWIGPYNSGQTGYGSHIWNKSGSFEISAKAKDTFGAESAWSESLIVIIENNPPVTPTITGQTSGKSGIEYTYVIEQAVDPEEHDLYAYWDWGDNNDSGWIGPYNSGEEINATHTWNARGNFTIKVKLKDIYEAESDWATLEVIIPRDKFSTNLLNLILERISEHYPIISWLLKLIIKDI